MGCIICGAKTEFLFRSSFDVSVSSDSQKVGHKIEILSCPACGHVQKEPSEKYLANVSDIYASYKMYELSEGHEQIKFGDTGAATRSQTILNNLSGVFDKRGKLLDVGTGNGAFLRAFSSQHAHWDLYAQDVSDHKKDSVLTIPNVKGFVHGDLSGHNQKYDCISLIHVVEHVIDLSAFLETLARLLTPEGFLLIQVPRFPESLYDAYIYDHVSHFSVETLRRGLAERLSYTHFPERQIFKEITYLASPSRLNKQYLPAGESPQGAPSSHPDIAGTLKKLEANLASVKTPSYVFGTAPAGTFVDAVLGSISLGFVDEDPHKIGKTVNGKLILSPQQLPAGAHVVAPVHPDIALRLVEKFASVNFFVP